MKIGVTTRNPVARLMQFNTGDPTRAYAFAAVITVIHAKRAEARIHEALAECRAEGEWFRCSAEKATALIHALVATKPKHH